MKKSDLTKAAKELNALFQPEPKIDVTATADVIKTQLAESIVLYREGDKISDESIAVWSELDWDKYLTEADDKEKDDDTGLTDRGVMEKNLHQLGIWPNVEEEEEDEDEEEEKPKKTKQPKASTKRTTKPVSEEEPEEEEKKPAKKPAAKKEKKKGAPTHASIMDEVLSGGGKWDKLIEKAQTALDEAGIEKKATEATIMAHVHYREKQGKSLGLAITEKGLEKK